MHRTFLKCWRKPTFRAAVLGLIAAEIGAVAWVYSTERSRLRQIEREVTYGKARESKEFWKFRMPGLRKPSVRTEAASAIADHEEVIGIVIDGRPRAYWLKALKYPPFHIVNDIVGGVPVSVTYCDRTDCSRVYIGREATEPLDIKMAGRYGGEMVVEIAGVLYLQRTGEPYQDVGGIPPIPYEEHGWERMSWGEWRSRHPDSDVFIGVGTNGPKP